MGYRLLLSALLAISLVYTFLARRIPMDPWTAEELINAQTLPTLYGSLLSIILILLLLRSAAPAVSIDPGRLVRGLGLFGLVFGFVALLGLLNLWLALGILLLTTAWWLGERRWLSMLLLAGSIPAIGYLGIELGLGVYLPD